MMNVGWIAAGLLGLGGFICCMNLYLSVVRYSIHRLRGGTRANYKYVSGFALLGSLLVALSLLKFYSHPVLLTIAIILILIDTGGLHWFLGSMFYHYAVLKGDRGSDDAKDKKATDKR
jgi:hypothetical protein